MDVAMARTFLEVVKTGSFVNAAANLHVTQTAVSARIRVLEEQLERPLFIRNKAGARLTPAGEHFLRFATTIVQAWERGRSAVALPAGKETVVTLGAELSLWNPLLKHWLLWMRRECPEIAVQTRIAGADDLMDRVQDGSLDVAVLYAAPRRLGVVAELLFEEKLVLVRTTRTGRELTPEDHVRIDWGDEFAERYQAAFPEQQSPVMSISYGPLALDYILVVGGSGYFREGFVRPWLEDGSLEIVPGSPEFSYSAYAVHSTKADEGVMARIRTGLRAAAALTL
ncbi:MAG: LysR family transcriptional regulator [Sphingomonas oligoaromativorans]|jgi:DNA-binding transcriptional LysR family regulator|uniref:LysR family transcriptional regulator n=1 Tax=Sphingomonas oligoaromativorans TaxID=575322 RepID=UPI00141F0384|nr:LysR family transcriptional regulator [Sphingomonas oligoaromativorans]NIJ32157.1 DNA-binding transcriptional LysR family regulator [Sphingomonas oligoaromativorans]